jgi:hypothetical protein
MTEEKPKTRKPDRKWVSGLIIGAGLGGLYSALWLLFGTPIALAMTGIVDINSPDHMWIAGGVVGGASVGASIRLITNAIDRS